MNNRFRNSRNLGVKKRDRLALFLPNCPEFIIAYFGIIKAGAAVVPINNMFKQAETQYIFDDANVLIAIVSVVFLEIVRSLKDKVSGLKQIILTDGVTSDTLNFYEIIERTPASKATEKINQDNIASIFYTSGTTGQPKGAKLTHKNFTSNCTACIKAINTNSRDNFICLLPMFHSFAWTVCVLMPLCAGASITIVDAMRPFRKVIRNVIKKKVTVFVAIPSIYHIFADMHIPSVFTSRVLRMIDPLRLCISGAAALPVEVLEKFQNKFRVPLLEGYGLTEASPVVSLNPMRGGAEARFSWLTD